MYNTKYMSPSESVMTELNIMANSSVFSSKEKSKLANIFRSCKNFSHINDFCNKLRPIYLSRIN